MKLPVKLVSLVFGLFFASAGALAVPILGGKVFVASTDNVIGKFLGADTAFLNDLFLSSPANSLGVIFNNLSTPAGTTLNLGSLALATELVFRIHVNDTGDDFFTGPAFRNPDAIEHAVVDDAFSATETLIAFEDLFGGGDLDFNDLQFSFTNVASAPPNRVPEPSSVLLLALGLMGMRLVQRQRQARQTN
jgi:hypothetical protein